MKDPLLQPLPGELCIDKVPYTMHIDEHIRKTQRQVAGKPRVCAEVIAAIIHIRRNNMRYNNYHAFDRYCNEYTEVLSEHLDTRWMVSVFDTYADMGESPRRELALMLSVFVNMNKVLDTVMGDNKIQKPAYGPLYDGLTTYTVQTGDMIKNLVKRIDRSVQSDPVLSLFWATIKERMRQNDSTLAQLNKLNRRHKFL